MAKKKATRRKRATTNRKRTTRRPNPRVAAATGTVEYVDTVPIEVQHPGVVSRPPLLRWWPPKVEIPKVYLKVRRQPPPCPSCRRVRTDEGRQAAVCKSSGNNVAWFRCKCCGHSWALPVQEV